MQVSGRNLFVLEEPPARLRAVSILFVLALFAIFEGCGGSSSPNYTNSTTQNPAPGITLEQIKIAPSTSIISLAETRQLFATGVYSDGSSVDISSQVQWGVTGAMGTTGNVTVSSTGVATGAAIGATVVTASAGTVSGLLQLTVSTNGFSSGTMAILAVPYKSTEVDVAYVPQQTKIGSTYAVQEVNLDADQFSSVLPVPLALRASIPMPSGFVPNAAAASQTTARVAVISYTSPQVQIIDASNDPLDVASNTLIATFTSPVKQSTTINGTSCMICAAVVNPLNDQLILSTAEGYYSMDLKAGRFTAIPFAPAPSPSANISLNPTATSPYLLSVIPQDGAVQVLDLTTYAVSTYSNLLASPAGAALDIATNYAAIVDASGSEQSLVDLANPQSPQALLAQGIGICGVGPAYMNMVAMGVSANPVVSNTAHTLFTSQTGGSCVGFQVWPYAPAAGALQNLVYGYGPLPSRPDGKPFVNGSDPGAIATFTSVVDKKNYGLLVDASQQWMAKINLGNALSWGNIAPPDYLPSGALMNPALLSDAGGYPMLYLPLPSTNFVLSTNSVDFGTVAAGTQSPTVIVSVNNIGTGTITPQISVQGTNAGDFSYQTTCPFSLLTQTNCTIDLIFTPGATGARSAVLNVSSPGLPTQSLSLLGNGS